MLIPGDKLTQMRKTHFFWMVFLSKMVVLHIYITTMNHCYYQLYQTWPSYHLLHTLTIPLITYITDHVSSFQATRPVPSSGRGFRGVPADASRPFGSLCWCGTSWRVLWWWWSPTICFWITDGQFMGNHGQLKAESVTNTEPKKLGMGQTPKLNIPAKSGFGSSLVCYWMYI